ncbi:MAG: hypothetical protein GC155_17800 [Alphaproteobacteria bacterium]|nr:hypothetical protein [Alphaproteobacteria bacterium]
MIRAACALACLSMTAFARPAAAQTVVRDWGAADMAHIFEELQIDKVAQGKQQGIPVVSGKTAGVYIVAVGDDCTEDATPRCGALNLVWDLDLSNSAMTDKAMNLLVYPAAAAVRSKPASLRLHRHVLLAGGVTDDNLRANVMLFIQTVFDAQNRLDEAKIF